MDALDTGFAGNLVVQQGSEYSGDTVSFAGNLSTSGHAITASADTIEVASGATLDTRAATGASGAITLEGKTVDVTSGTLLADTSLGAAAGGTISLDATDETYRTVELPIDYVAKSVAIDLQGASISGGSVVLDSSATDLSIAGEVPSYAQSYVGNAEALLEQIPGELISAITGIDASVILRGADAGITVGGTQITSSGGVSIQADTATSSLVQAIATGLGGASNTTGFQAAVGYSQSTGSATIDIGGDSGISAAGDVTVLANGSTDATATASASSNAKASNTTTGASITVAIVYSDLTSTATLDPGSTIDAGGSVNFNATGTTTAEPQSTVAGYNNGRSGSSAGVSLALDYDHADITSTVNGDITAAGNATAGAGAGSTGNFEGDSAGAVNTATDTITLDDHGLTSGDQVVYNANSLDTVTGTQVPATPIGGLTSGQTYYALVTDANHVQLANAPVIALDPTGDNPASVQTLSAATALDLDLGAVSSNTVYLAGHGFSTGDLLVYSAGGNQTPIQGLANGGTYEVNAVDGSDFQLETNGTVVPISQGAALGTQTFDDITANSVQTLDLASISGATISTADALPASGTVLTYQDLTGTSADIGSLTDGTAYTIDVTGPTTFQLLDSTGTPIQLTQPSAPGKQAFAYISEVLSFNPVSDIAVPSSGAASITGEITLPSTAGLTTGTPGALPDRHIAGIDHEDRARAGHGAGRNRRGDGPGGDRGRRHAGRRRGRPAGRSGLLRRCRRRHAYPAGQQRARCASGRADRSDLAWQRQRRQPQFRQLHRRHRRRRPAHLHRPGRIRAVRGRAVERGVQRRLRRHHVGRLR